MRKRVLFFSHEDRGNLAGSTYSLLNLIHSVQNDVEVLVVSRKGKAFDYLVDNGVPCFQLGLPMRLCVWYKESAKLRIAENVIRAIYNYGLNFFTLIYLYYKFHNKVDIIHTNSSVLDIGFLLSRLLKVKHVWHIREFQDIDHDMYPILGTNIFKKMLEQSDEVICISNAISSHFNLDGKCSVIYDAVIHKSEVIKLEKKEKYFLYAGGGKLKKGILDAIRVFKLLPDEYELLIAGSLWGADKQKLLNLIDGNSRIKLLGFRKDLKSLMAKAQAYLMCSHNEGLGRVTVEAMAFGCPVIGKKSGATEEIISHGATGWLYSTDEEFVSCVKDLLSSPKKSLEIISRAQTFVINNFEESVYRDQILSVYNRFVI